MRVAVVGAHAPSLLNFREELLRSLVERKHDVVACAPKASPRVQEKLARLGVRYHDVPIARTGLSPIADCGTTLALANVFRSQGIEAVLAYTAKPVIYSCLAARLSKNPAVYCLITGLGYAFGGSTVGQRLVGRLVKGLYRTSLKSAAAVFFQNPDDREFFTAAGLLHNVPTVQVNGSGVNLERFSPESIPSAPVFLLVARLLADKGIKEYCEAALVLRQRYPDARFLLAGPFDSNPRSLSPGDLRQYEVPGAIEYLGALDDVRPAYAAAQVYVLPSYREGTPRTVLEAMAMARPIITTDAPGCRETVVHGVNGFLVDVRSVDGLIEAMERFIKEPDLAARMGAESLRLVREKYDVHDVNSVIVETMGL
jgi:glycosyltransferase involved in cell wall biosynthesis